MNISDEAVEAAGEELIYHQRRDITGCMCGWSELGRSHAGHQARKALEAAAPHLQDEAALMRWKLDALKRLADAMISESQYPQYGVDVKTLLEVGSMDEAREVDAP